MQMSVRRASIWKSDAAGERWDDSMTRDASARLVIPEAVRGRAMNLGAEGLAWLEDIESTVAAIAREWGLALGAVMHGGSEAFVAEARTSEGRRAVLKIGIPGSESGRQEARVLKAAAGRGYAQILRHDGGRRAMLMERLGPPLEDLGLSIDEQVEIICTTLKTAWCHPPPETQFMNGAAKADSLAAFISETWAALGRPCSKRVIDRALAYARIRGRAFTAESALLAHGDAHSANTLFVPGSEPRSFKFIDPDGLFIEPAYDLAICMRGWGAPLLAGDAVALGWKRAALLASLTGVEPQPIWEWGFIERVSTGLFLKQLGREAEASEFLAVAELWAVNEAGRR